jgi:cell division protein ZapE
MTISEYYDMLLRERGYHADAAQRYAVQRLQRYYDEWVNFKAKRANPWTRLLHRPEVPRGVYLWGGVGRGKSFLMDAFYATVPVHRKTRVHFHEFMQSVHREMREVRGVSDPLDEVGRRVAKRYRLICFDEFHVSDVADAMILYRLLRKLFECGTSFVMTSNYEPATLYPDALQRERILPAIELIQTRMEVIQVDAGVDYRHRPLTPLPVYHAPNGAAAEAALREAFRQFAPDADAEAMPVMPQILQIMHRPLAVKALAKDTVWCDFVTLCRGARSQNDYLALASRFRVLILSDVPCMSARDAAAARRFTWLVDVLYDYRVKLIVSAECPPEKLYQQGALAHEFERTISRLREMQSQEYLDAPWREGMAL